MPHSREAVSILFFRGNQLPLPHNFNAEPTSLLDTYLKMPVAKRKERFASTYDVARMLNLTRHTIQNWINQGWIAAVRIGKKFQVDLCSVEAYLRKRAAEDAAS